MKNDSAPILALLVVTLVTLATLLVPGAGGAQVARRAPHDPVGHFALSDIDGDPVTSDELRGRAWFLTFLTAHQKRSERAVDDLARLVSIRRDAGQRVDLLVVVSGGEGVEFFRGKEATLPPGTRMLLDPGDALWGRLGVVVTPTSLLIDADGDVRWVRAGHSFDFMTEARASLDRVLGLAQTPADPNAESVSAGDDPSEQAWRHQRMAEVLARRGEIEPALEEIRKAVDFTPGAFPVQAEFARLLCRSGQADAALAVVDALHPETSAERARAAMLAGWARRQRGDLDRARTLLEEAVTLDPGADDSGRALYELGRVFDQQGDCGRALEMYRRALETRLDR